MSIDPISTAENKFPLGQRVALPGHFLEPVTLEAIRFIGSGYECRVRLGDGTPDEAILSLEEAAALAGQVVTTQAVIHPADAEKLRLLVESARIRLAYAHDRQFAVSLSGIRTLPHQIEAVYMKMLPQPRLRFLLADDPGAGLSQKKIAPKFEEYVKVFLAWSKQHHRPKTTALHTTNCDTLKRFFKGDWLDEIDQAAVENYKSDRIKEDRRNADDGSKVTGATVNRSLTTLKLMFGRAEKCGFGVSNPVRGVAYLPESAGRIRVVSFQEELTYLSKASQPLRDIAQTILDTGLRPEEVFRIRVENIDFAARTIFNPFGKTKAARRTVTMTEAVWTALKRRAQAAKGSYVFPSEKHPDRPIASVRKGHNAAIRRAAIKQHFVLYDLRHTFATRAVAAGVDLPTLSAMLGHTSITMTMRYVHPAAEQKRLAAAKLETFRVNGLMVAASEQAAERERLAGIEQAAEQERLAAAKLETFRINALMEAASEQTVCEKTGAEARIH